MDWRYVWAYHRIADREGRRADDVSAQLAALAKQTPEQKRTWEVGEPGRGPELKGLWEDSAWGTYDGWGLEGIKQPRNFFSPKKNFIKKLDALGRDHATLAKLRDDFAGVFARDAKDVKALRELRWSLDDLTFHGAVVVGWGVPKGVVWIGVTEEEMPWEFLPEERAALLLSPIKRFALRPATKLLASPPNEAPWHSSLRNQQWRDAVASSLLGTTSDGRQRNVLVCPSRDEIVAARLRQIRDDIGPIQIMDHVVLQESSRFFPWLWWESDAIDREHHGWYRPDHIAHSYATRPAQVLLDKKDDFDEFVRAVLVKSVIFDHLVLLLRNDRCAECYRSVFGSDCSFFKTAEGRAKVQPVHISPAVCRFHNVLLAMLRAITDWVLGQQEPDAHSHLAHEWSHIDTTYAEHIRTRCSLSS